MDWDELEPRKAKPKPKDLQPMSIAELTDYIAELEAEIVRAREMIAAKRKERSGAEGLFRK
jgi:uncharacterized small protein (DUF1192 family)